MSDVSSLLRDVAGVPQECACQKRGELFGGRLRDAPDEVGEKPACLV